jgi:spermidine synthase
MGLEILAGRMVAPAFGSSVYTWGSIIGVFLAALSLGYALGGRYAASHASNRALAILSAMAAVSVATVAVGGGPVIAWFDTLNLVEPRYAAIIPVTLLFGPMTFLLGVISPFAAEQSSAQSHGSASGRVYAVGTIGSIVGAFGTTFLLIPAFPVGEVALLLTLPLLAVAVAVGDRHPPVVAAVGLAVVAVGLAGFVVVAGPTLTGDTIYETQTAYSDLEVRQSDGVRTMYIGGVAQSATYVDGREGYVFDYAPYMHIPMLMTEDVDRVLFIGGGGFTGPQRYVEEYPNVTVDAVEIDPQVVDTAERYFRLQESDRLNVHVADGRDFLQSTNHTYDVIILDAFQTDKVPFHLTTREFMELTNSKLDDDGVFMANIISARSGEGSAFYRAMVKTVDATYPHLYTFPTADTADLQNIELVATKNPDGFSQADLQRLNDRRDIGLDLTAEIRRYRRAGTVRTDDIPVLTDDYAPVDSLLDEQVDKPYVITGWNGTTATG